MEEAKAIHTLILDTNVLISSLIREEGITRTCLTILLHDENCHILTPADVVSELRTRTSEICNKAGIPQPLLQDTLDGLLERIELTPASSYENESRLLTEDAYRSLSFRDDSSYELSKVGLLKFNLSEG